MKIYEQEDVCKLFTKHVRVNFDTNGDASIYYGCTAQFISNIKNDKAAPNEQMLKDIGFVRKNGFIKDKG